MIWVLMFWDNSDPQDAFSHLYPRYFTREDHVGRHVEKALDWYTAWKARRPTRETPEQAAYNAQLIAYFRGEAALRPNPPVGVGVTEEYGAWYAEMNPFTGIAARLGVFPEAVAMEEAR